MSFPDIGAFGIIAVIIGAIAIIGFIRGLIRTALALICLAIAAYTGLWGHEHTNQLISSGTASLGPWLPKIVAVITGLTVFFICRYLLKFLVDPFNQSAAGKKIGFGLPAAVISLCMGLALIWIACTGIRYLGSLTEIKQTQQIITAQKERNNLPLEPTLLSLQRLLDSHSLGKWQRDTDFTHAPNQIKLSKLLILYHHTPTRDKMLQNNMLNPLLNHTAFLELAYKASIQELSQSEKYRALLHSPHLRAFLSREKNREALAQITSSHINDFLLSLQEN